MKMLFFKSIRGQKIAIVAEKITGIISSMNESCGKTFIATGADSADGGENGFYVNESFDEVIEILEGA